MRRTWIHLVLPFAFAVLPAAAGALIVVAIPPAARADYLERLRDSHIDWIILAFGGVLFAAQTVLGFRALQLRDDEPGFNEKPDKWLNQLGQAAEWFPLLGLIGTVAAILQTFSSFTPDKPPTYSDIIRKYGPAITATGSGLFMALMNILPGWMVVTGRQLIVSLGETPAPPPPAYRPPMPAPTPVEPVVPLTHVPPGANYGKPEGRA